MRVPNVDRAVIDPMKLHGYLLSPTHPVGRIKAAFFRTLGYVPDDWRRLEVDLRTQHLSQDATLQEQNSYGEKYSISAPLVGPYGRPAHVSVWFVRTGEEVAGFVTAYPGVGR